MNNGLRRFATHVTVVGTGVVAMTTALCLRRVGVAVSVIGPTIPPLVSLSTVPASSVTGMVDTRFVPLLSAQAHVLQLAGAFETSHGLHKRTSKVEHVFFHNARGTKLLRAHTAFSFETTFPSLNFVRRRELLAALYECCKQAGVSVEHGVPMIDDEYFGSVDAPPSLMAHPRILLRDANNLLNIRRTFVDRRDPLVPKPVGGFQMTDLFVFADDGADVALDVAEAYCNSDMKATAMNQAFRFASLGCSPLIRNLERFACRKNLPTALTEINACLPQRLTPVIETGTTIIQGFVDSNAMASEICKPEALRGDQRAKTETLRSWFDGEGVFASWASPTARMDVWRASDNHGIHWELNLSTTGQSLAQTHLGLGTRAATLQHKNGRLDFDVSSTGMWYPMETRFRESDEGQRILDAIWHKVGGWSSPVGTIVKATKPSTLLVRDEVRSTAVSSRNDPHCGFSVAVIGPSRWMPDACLKMDIGLGIEEAASFASCFDAQFPPFIDGPLPYQLVLESIRLFADERRKRDRSLKRLARVAKIAVGQGSMLRSLGDAFLQVTPRQVSSVVFDRAAHMLSSPTSDWTDPGDEKQWFRPPK